MNILWFCSWYPNKTEPLNGDFVQRHAKAVSLYTPITVIHVIRDKNGSITKDEFVDETINGNLHELIVYYYSRHYSSGIVDKIFSQLKYWRIYKKIVRRFIKDKGGPSIIHVHHGMKAGSIALHFKKRMNIPYILTEHWAGFSPEANPRFDDFPFYIQRVWRKVIKEATVITAVSDYLGKQMQRVFGSDIPLKIIPNVVDSDIFYPEKRELSSVARFVHISGLDFQKNPEHILEAFSILKYKGILFHLDIFGPDDKHLKIFANQLGLKTEIQFHREVAQPELANFVRKSDALILYSRYESFGCVLIEAGACGIPVIASDLTVLKEIVAEGENGILVKGEDPVALAEAIILFIHERDKYSSDIIATNAKEKYNFNKIGQEFFELYNEILNKE